jgi:hypothetical protein
MDDIPNPFDLALKMRFNSSCEMRFKITITYTKMLLSFAMKRSISLPLTFPERQKPEGQYLESIMAEGFFGASYYCKSDLLFC